MSKHNNLIVDAHNARKTITDTEARRIASEWHGGGGTALYAFSSTGAIDTARADHDIEREIEQCIASIAQDYAGMSNAEFASAQRDLRNLHDYIRANGSRGPINGWSDLTW